MSFTVLENSLPDKYEFQQPANNMPPVTIEGIEVPYEVLFYAQMAFQGYAVTQAKEIVWNDNKVYFLRIDNDSDPDDDNGMILIYNLDWKLLAEKACLLYLQETKPVEIIPPVQEEQPPAPLPTVETVVPVSVPVPGPELPTEAPIETPAPITEPVPEEVQP